MFATFVFVFALLIGGMGLVNLIVGMVARHILYYHTNIAVQDVNFFSFTIGGVVSFFIACPIVMSLL